MIPILQFDPATLTLWYDTQLLATSRASREVGLALHFAIDGREDRLKCLFRQQADPWIKTRCATVASAVWHEKRHFLDFILTNYGAMRIRQYFQCYMNARVFLQKTKENGPLLLPLDRNLDQLRCAMMGVNVKDPDLHQFAKGIRSAKRMLLQDRRPIISGGNKYEVGGEAILECIAYNMQLGKTHRVFGGETNANVQRDNPSHDTVADKYQWILKFLIQTDLVKAVYKEDAVGQPHLLLQDGPVVPLLYAALASRYHGQRQTWSNFVSSYHPGERLASLVARFNEQRTDLAEMSVIDAWNEVNMACRAIFGRSALEEIDADYEKEGDLIAQFRAAGTDEFVASAYEDFHLLRKSLIKVLKDDPEAILDQAKWSDNFVNKTRPFVVAAAPAGVIGTPPEGFDRLSGYAEENTDFDQIPEFRWWWTALRKENEIDGQDEIYRLSDQNAWGHIASDFAPLAKLMIDGNRMRSMVGPELISAKTRIEHLTGVSLVVDSLSRYPEEEFDISQWYFLTGQDRFRCQVTHRIVHAPSGRLIGPWEFRRRPNFRLALLEFLGESQRQRMLRAIWRDWSPWLVCDEVGAIFDAAKIDHSAEI